jgi:hypothetical protein
MIAKVLYSIETTRRLRKISTSLSMDFVFTTTVNGDSPLEIQRKPPEKNHVSFRDKLIGRSQTAPNIREKVDLIAQKLVRIEHEDGNRLLPKVYLDENVFKDIMCSTWNDAIMVKLLGKTLGYKIMKDRLQKIWRLAGGFDMRDICG